MSKHPDTRIVSDLRRGRAQAMVEFALALPIFLLLVYGILEVGRLLFMDAAVITASREAVRYASAWGVGGGGARYQYQDCTGIRNAAKNTGFLLGLSDSNIQIGWDPGTSTTVTTYCPGSVPDTSVSLTGGQRVVVTVTANYSPILPLFLPLTPNTLSSTTRRTILGVVNLNTPTP